MTYVTIMMGKHNYAGIFAIMVMYPQNGIMSSTARSHTGVTHTHTHPHTHTHTHTKHSDSGTNTEELEPSFGYESYEGDCCTVCSGVFSVQLAPETYM